jgi:hypothetical protein
MIAPFSPRYRNELAPKSSKLARKAFARNNKSQHYILEVGLRVKPGMMDEFATQAAKILPSVEIRGLQLLAAGICLDPDPRKVIHLWELASADLLRDAMIRLSDVPAYGLLDEMVVDEVQEICTSLLKRPPKPKSELYVRMTGVLRTKDLAEFVAEAEAGQGLFAKKSGWRIAGALINVTGRVNRISLIWAVPSETGARKFATAVPGYDFIVDPETEVWRGTDYDPPVNPSEKSKPERVGHP